MSKVKVFTKIDKKVLQSLINVSLSVFGRFQSKFVRVKDLTNFRIAYHIIMPEILFYTLRALINLGDCLVNDIGSQFRFFSC
jgi:hypothetical protein